MQGAQRSTLVVGVDQQTFEKVSKALGAVKFFADYAETGAAALESTSFLPFDAIVTGYPLPDMQMQTFLDAVRTKDSPCRQASLVILALRGMLPEVEAFIGKGANRVLAIEDFQDELPQALFRLLEVPPRFAVRAISRLKVQLSWGTSQTICQTENISAPRDADQDRPPVPGRHPDGVRGVDPGRQQPDPRLRRRGPPDSGEAREGRRPRRAVLLVPGGRQEAPAKPLSRSS